MNRAQKRRLERNTRRNMSKQARTPALGAGPGGPSMVSQKDVFAKIGMLTVEVEQSREIISNLIQQCQGYLNRLKAANLLLPEEQEEIDMAEANEATAAEDAVPMEDIEAAVDQAPTEQEELPDAHPGEPTDEEVAVAVEEALSEEEVTS